MIEALNFMVSKGWKFVQAYSSGSDGDYTNILLRISTSRLEELEKQSTAEQTAKAETQR